MSGVATRDRHAGWYVLAYFAVYFASLWWSLENEFRHWLFLVLVPAVGLLWVLRTPLRQSPAALLSEFGLRRSSWRAGLAWAIPLGLGLSALQLLVSRNRADALEVLTSVRVLYLVPLALVLLLATAATTEEVFFRGMLLERLSRWWRAPALALLGSAVLFGVYHLPYAYLNPHWPSHGDFLRAVTAALGQGIIGGLILGAVYIGARRNLLAPIIVHALINLLPALASLGRSA